MLQSLLAPSIYPDVPVWTPPPYSYTGMAASLNAAITAAIAAGKNGLKVPPCLVYCDVPVVMPNAGFDLIGLGRIIPNVGAETYAGGVKFVGPYGAATSALKLNGTGVPSSAGCMHARVENIAFAGLYTNANVFGATGGPVPLVDVESGYKIIFSECCWVADNGQLLKMSNVWDSDFWNSTFINGGSCDPTVTTDNTTVQGYTGRSFLAVETAIGRSLGVPAIEIISPNTNGTDVSNNIDFYALHMETGAENGVAILLRGGNGNNCTFASGSKIERREQSNPLIVVQDQVSFRWDGLLYGAGIGVLPGPVGSLASGATLKSYTNPGLILMHNCLSPRVLGSIGYDGYGGGGSQATAPLQAFARFINCVDPQINANIGSGLDSLVATGSGGARMIFDGCTDVSNTLTRAYASTYLKGLTHANATERVSLNGTTTVDTGSGGPGSDTTAARLTDPRFAGIQRIDLIASYGAKCDGTSHPLSGLYASLSAAQGAYPNAGLTSANWSATELDTAAWLQCAYFLSNAAGGIIGLADGAGLMASQTLWLQQGGKVFCHGGRNTRVYGEFCGSTPVLRASNTFLSVTGPAQPVPFKDLDVFAWNAGRAYFSAAAGVAAPGYANAAAMSGNPGGYRTGSCALQIDDGGAYGQSSGLSGVSSVYTTIDAVRWFNFDDATRWGDNTFSITFRHCMAENNNKGVCWAQTTGLNSMERMVFEGGSYSNNNYAFYWNSNWPSSTQGQGGSIFIRNASIDYNQISQGYFNLTNAGQTFPQSSVHFSGNHVENRAEVTGSTNAWFTLIGVGMWTDNEFYINTQNSAATAGLVSISDNGSGSMFNNRIGGACPLFISTTSNAKMVSAAGNTQQPMGSAVIALMDAAGTAIQAPRADEPVIAEPYSGTFALTPTQHGNLSAISLEGSGALTFALPAEGSGSFRPGWFVIVQNSRTTAVTISVPSGSTVVGCYGSASPTGGTADTSRSIPANSFATLLRRSNQWLFLGGMTQLGS